LAFFLGKIPKGKDFFGILFGKKFRNQIGKFKKPKNFNFQLINGRKQLVSLIGHWVGNFSLIKVYFFPGVNYSGILEEGFNWLEELGGTTHTFSSHFGTLVCGPL